MGISLHVAEMIVREHAYRPIIGKVVLLGHQTMLFTPQEAVDLVRSCGLTPQIFDIRRLAVDGSTLLSSEGVKGYIRDLDFFSLLGVRDVVALDHSDYEGAELIWNLNVPIPLSLEAVADLIIDGSTIDNVFDPACTLRNISRMLRPKGRLISTAMGSNHYAPYVIPSPQWLFDYFVYNRYSDISAYYLVPAASGLNMFRIDLASQSRSTPCTETLHCPYIVGVVTIAEKGDRSTWNVNPSQHHYRSSEEWDVFDENIKPILASRRPLHIRSRSQRDGAIPDLVGFSFIEPTAPLGSEESEGPGAVDLVDAQTFSEILGSFSGCGLVGVSDEEQLSRWAEAATDAAGVLLSSSQFARRSPSDQARIIRLIHNVLMSRPGPALPAIAELAVRRLRAMLSDPRLTEIDLCSVYDAIHAMYFAGITDVRDLRRADAIVPVLEDWLVARHRTVPRPTFERSTDDPLTIVYLVHTGNLARGNAVTPLMVSLARMHAQRTNRKIIVYLVQYVSPDFKTYLSEQGIEFRNFEQGDSYDRLDDIAESIRVDGADVVITEQNRAIAAALFVRRVAPLQLWLDTGFPFWSLRSLDWTIAPTRSEGADLAHTSFIAWRQASETLTQPVEDAAVAAVRALLPEEAFVLGIFVRLIKIDRAFLDFVARLLSSCDRFHLVLAGPGDSALIRTFLAEAAFASRVTFIAGNVDLNVYGQVVDVMCDTFPFIGGNACREVTALGTPVVSKLGTPWDGVLHADRSPELLAADEAEYIALVNRLRSDATFMERQRSVALELAEAFTEPTRMVDDVEAAIGHAVAARRQTA